MSKPSVQAVELNGRAMHHGLCPQDWKQVQEWNASCPEAVDICIHDLIHRRAKLQPAAVAICSWDGRLTYLELDEATSRLASFLVQEGVVAGTCVPICFEKSKWAVITMIAIMKAGGIFVPFDSNQPIGRLNAMMEDTESGLIASSVSLSAKFINKTRGRVLVVSQDLLDSLPLRGYEITKDVTPENVAFIMFTVRVAALETLNKFLRSI